MRAVAAGESEAEAEVEDWGSEGACLELFDQFKLLPKEHTQQEENESKPRCMHQPKIAGCPSCCRGLCPAHKWSQR